MIHQGIDIVGPSGQDIIAIADGWIAETHDERCMGPTVVIDHGRDKEGRRLIALYGHVQDILVEEGQRVSRGDIVARLGNNHHKYRGMCAVAYFDIVTLIFGG
ncbi:MAG: M23 family metallopeptidase, partial [Rhodospirillales bacterium]|nr:M23 family metallopeptidase [Rhodospirillales bacterium]